MKLGQIVFFEDDPAGIDYLKSVIGLLGYELTNFMPAKDGIEFLRNNRVALLNN